MSEVSRGEGSTEWVKDASAWTVNQLLSYGWYGTTIEQKFVAGVILSNPSWRRWAFAAGYQIAREAVMGQVRLGWYLAQVTYKELIVRPLKQRAILRAAEAAAKRPTLLQKAATAQRAKAAAARPPQVWSRMGGGLFGGLATGGAVIVNAWQVVEQTFLDPNTGDFDVA